MTDAPEMGRMRNWNSICPAHTRVLGGEDAELIIGGLKMDTWRELGRAFGYVPKLFGMVYRTDRRYLFSLICETLSFAVLAYPGMFLVKYAFDAMERRQPFGEFAAVCILLLLLQLAINLIKSFFNSIRPGRTSLVVGKLYNAFHRKSMELDYELLAEKEIQELQVLAGDFIRYRLSDTVWNFVALFSSLIAFAVSYVSFMRQEIRSR